MMKNTALQKFYEATKIPLQFFDDNKLIEKYGSDHFCPNPAAGIVNLAANIDHSVCCTVSPEYLFYGLIRIENSSGYLIVGPAMSSECTQKQAQNILTGMHQPTSRTDELLRWFHLIPFCDMQRFRGILCFLDCILNERDEQVVVHIPYQANDFKIPEIDSGSSFIEQINDEFDEQLLSSVEYGDLKALESVFENWDSHAGELPLVATDTVRSFKNIFIYVTGVVSMAARKGGLEFDIVTAVTSTYLMQIEKLHSYPDIYNLLKRMFLDFTKRTARCRSFLSDSLVVNKICKDVQTHLYEKISPTIISERLNMNCSYICGHFKQKMGKTIMEFVNELKIQEGIRLLETTEMSLIQISTQLGFSSQNYFHAVFKKMTGMTPMEYKSK